MGEQLTYRDAIIRALADELDADADVVLFGEDIGAAGGVFKTTVGLHERFGGGRVRDTPIAEQAIVGCAIGAAATGLRPVAEIMFADFAAVCFDQIANQAAKLRYMTGGQLHAPMTIRMANGGTVGFAAQHSQTAESWFLNVPGLKLAVPATAGDAYGLLRAAIRDDDPVIVLEHKALMGGRGDVDTSGPARLGEAEVVRAGRDVTVVATQLMRHRAVEAAEVLAAEGIEIEVIDPRTLIPLDLATIVDQRLAHGPARVRAGVPGRRLVGRHRGGPRDARRVHVARRGAAADLGRRHADSLQRPARGRLGALRRPHRRRAAAPRRGLSPERLDVHLARAPSRVRASRPLLRSPPAAASRGFPVIATAPARRILDRVPPCPAILRAVREAPAHTTEAYASSTPNL